MKYIDNYILAILISLDFGNTINYNNIDDLPENIKVKEDRRLEKDFIGTLRTTVFNSLPKARYDELLKKPLYHIQDDDNLDNIPNASEINTPTLDEVLLCIKTSNNDFPITKAPDTTEIYMALKQYTEALQLDNISDNAVKYIKWQFKVKKFLKQLDKEQLLENYTFDNDYIKHLPVILYGYVKDLVVFNEYHVTLKQIPFDYECEDSCEPVTKNMTNSDNESDYIELSANADIKLLYEDLIKITNTKKKLLSQKEKIHGFTSKQWKLLKKVILDYENNDCNEISFKHIMDTMCRSKRHATNYRKIVQNHVSKINANFNKIFGYPIFARCSLTTDTYPLCEDFRNNFDTVLRTFELE